MRSSGPTVLRVYHAGGEPGHQQRDRALAAAGARVVLVVPGNWRITSRRGTGPTDAQPSDAAQSGPELEVLGVEVSRPGDVNRHRHLETDRLAALIRRVRPDILDVHEEPVSVAMRQLLALAPAGLPVVGYTAQNLDKRFPPPYTQYERSALGRLSGLYPCSKQAASVAWGKGFRGHVRVLPLGYDPDLFWSGDQGSSLGSPLLVLAGRLVPEKGVRDAVDVLAAIRQQVPARLVLVGSGPEVESAIAQARAAGLGDALTHRPWLGPAELAELYRQAHVVLAPSRSTTRWVEQFGRMVIEAQASGAVVCGYATGALPEVGGPAAILVSDGNTEALAENITSVLTDANAWRERSARGVTAARTRTWESVAQDQIAFYQDVLRGPQRRSSAPPDAASRQEARELYGRPASAPNLTRPFAIPVLRDLGATQVKLGRLVDAVTEAARWGRQRVRGTASDR